MIEYNGPLEVESWNKFLAGEYRTHESQIVPPKDKRELQDWIKPIVKIYKHIKYIITHNPLFALGVFVLVLVVGIISYMCSMKLDKELEQIVKEGREKTD
jgi:hypothetical protein